MFNDCQKLASKPNYTLCSTHCFSLVLFSCLFSWIKLGRLDKYKRVCVGLIKLSLHFVWTETLLNASSELSSSFETSSLATFSKCLQSYFWWQLVRWFVWQKRMVSLQHLSLQMAPHFALCGDISPIHTNKKVGSTRAKIRTGSALFVIGKFDDVNGTYASFLSFFFRSESYRSNKMISSTDKMIRNRFYIFPCNSHMFVKVNVVIVHVPWI